MGGAAIVSDSETVMRNPRLLLPLLLVLTLLQGLAPLLHAHREAPVFVGALHIHGGVTLAVPSFAPHLPGEPGLSRSAFMPDQGAIVTTADEYERRTSLTPPDEILQVLAALPDPVAPLTWRPADPGAPVEALRGAYHTPPSRAPPNA